jgi:hypothetical protein
MIFVFNLEDSIMGVNTRAHKDPAIELDP